MLAIPEGGIELKREFGQLVLDMGGQASTRFISGRRHGAMAALSRQQPL
jgi:hypothetical protein